MVKGLSKILLDRLPVPIVEMAQRFVRIAVGWVW
jgi:hypothetical protein